MKETFASEYGRSFSVGRFRRNLLFYNGFTITNALRSQFDVEGYEKLPEGNPTISMRVIEGRGR